jgi:hypothetical protein
MIYLGGLTGLKTESFLLFVAIKKQDTIYMCLVVTFLTVYSITQENGIMFVIFIFFLNI